MKTYTLTLELCSPTLVGSGEGFGALIDADVVFDDVGLPYIPAKRIKGCLRDTALDVQDMFKLADIPLPPDIDATFGITGDSESAPVYFTDLTIELASQYQQTQEWLTYLLKAKVYPSILSQSQIIQTFTKLRQQTRIDEDGTADEHSLRTSRVLKSGLKFYGTITVRADDADDKIQQTLLLACLNFRAFGTKRNRGFGEVRCTLQDQQGNNIPFPEQLEGLCTK